MEIRLRHWLIALLVAGSVHAALALTLVAVPNPPSVRSMTIALTLGTGDGGVSAQPGEEEPAGRNNAEAAQATPESAPEPEAPKKSVSETEPVAESEPELESETELNPEPESESKPEEQSIPITPVIKTEAPKPRTSSVQHSSPKPRPSSVQRSKPKRDTNNRGSAARATSSTKKPVSKAGGPSLTNNRNNTHRGVGAGVGSSNSTGSALKRQDGSESSGISSASYYRQLARALQKHKHYPSQARRLRQEGTVKVRFTIDRHGRIISQHIVASSGHTRLDREVEEMLRRASPLPAIPASLSRSQLTLTLPIVFKLR
jgi:protein TonB